MLPALALTVGLTAVALGILIDCDLGSMFGCTAAVQFNGALGDYNFDINFADMHGKGGAYGAH